ncbi:hypothetical protein [Parapedobacter sp. 10938]|uniref:hypothetical protein n=1 Tax=Parapedobacter flavus TaxID=3110225 RepID=UPI002DBD7FED|nr:hypothetical protein [Parapedobacter sp. 10938]MEC3878635.1 hypothetical protein [Parapedobacter sp. 10938]
MKKIFAIAILIQCVFYIRAQPPLGLPSPNNAFLGQGGSDAEVGVDLYTGTAQINIPIATAQGKDLSIPVSLNYVGGRGIRVQDYASNVGLGWQLAAGGNISRVVRGLPDEHNQGYLGNHTTSHEWGKKVADWANNNTPLPDELTGGPWLDPPTADGEPDLFVVKTPFFSVQFVLDENGEAVFSNNTGLKIIPHIFHDTPTSPEGYGFTVVDGQGNRYCFGGAASSFTESVTSKLLAANRTYVSTWYLHRIITYNDKETILFSYISSPANMALKHHHSSITGNGSGSWQPAEHETSTTTVSQPRQLSEIQTSVSRIMFSYAFDRTDLTNAARLTAIAVSARTGTTATKLLRTYRFEYGYFGMPSSDPERLRLRLDGINVEGNGELAGQLIPYREFEYYTGYQLPVRDTDQFDYWGYYRIISGDPLKNPGLRTPNLNQTKAGILVSIGALGGAETELNYELNSCLYSLSSNIAVGGLRVKSIVRRDPGNQTLTTTYNYNDGQGRSNGRIRTFSYDNLTISNAANTLVKNFSESVSNIYDLNGTFIGYRAVKTISPSGGYTVARFNSFSDFPDDMSNWDSNPSGSTRPPNISSSINLAYKRGVPQSYTVYDANGDKLTVDSFVYVSQTTPLQRKAFAWQKVAWGMTIPNQSAGFVVSYHYWTNVENFRVVQAIKRVYDQANPGVYAEATAGYQYSPNGYFLVRSPARYDSQNRFHETVTYYSADPVAPVIMPDYEANLSMRQANMLTAIRTTETTVNGKAEKTENTYRRVPGTSPVKVRLVASETFSDGVSVGRSTFTYDSKENLVTTQPDHGMPTTVLYSYNNTYPIAEIQNADYATVVTALGGPAAVDNFAASFAPTAAQVTAFLAPLRTASSLSAALVTTRAYEPGVGVIQEADPRGKVLSYEYDGLQRLLLIRDHNGKIAEEYKYNYRID